MVTIIYGDENSVTNVRAYGAAGNGINDDTAAVLAAAQVVKSQGFGTLEFPPGTYATTGIVLQGMPFFTISADRGSVLTLLPNTVVAPNRANANVLTIADSSDFSVNGLTVDGQRDTIAPMTILAANAAFGQPSVQVANGAAAAYQVGQFLNVCGGLTVASGADANKQDANLTILSITPGTSGAPDTITFTTNLANSYTYSASAAFSDGYGPYAAPGAYVTPWQTGSATVAGRSLAAEDQQQGIHLINCTRFQVTGCQVHNVWESGIRCGTHNQAGTAQTDGCSHGTITGNTIRHGYDQGIGLWCSSNITVTANDVSAAGWAGLCMTLSDDCTISANISASNVQRIPGDTAEGSGVAIEGGARNKITGNTLTNNYRSGIYLTAGGTLPFGGPAQLATTVASASNAVALPTGTINLASVPSGWASSGQCTVLSSTGAQQITYTGVSGNQLTGCTGGTGTMYTGQRVTQYPSFTANGAALAIGSASTTVSSGSLWQVGGHYSIVDGPRTERVDALTVSGTTVTLTAPTKWQHSDKCQVSQAVCEDNVLIGNTISGGLDSGIKLAAAVRTLIEGNIVNDSGLTGVDLTTWTGAGLQPPTGTVIKGNSIQGSDTTGSGSQYGAIMAQQCSDLLIIGNRMTGAMQASTSYAALYLQAVSDSAVQSNEIADAYGVGIRLDSFQEAICRGVQVEDNTVSRCYGEGIIVWGGDALEVSGNTITGCAPYDGPGGYGGGLNLRGITNSQIISNTVLDCGHGGIGLDSASVTGATLICVGNVISHNVVRDDGNNYSAYTGAHLTQGNGISELSSGQGPNAYLFNLVSGSSTNWTISSTGNTLRGNQNYNPRTVTSPAVPGSGTAYANVLNVDCVAYVTGGTVTGIAVNGTTTGLTAGAIRVPAGSTITLTYSAAPTWVWVGE